MAYLHVIVGLYLQRIQSVTKNTVSPEFAFFSHRSQTCEPITTVAIVIRETVRYPALGGAITLSAKTVVG